MEPLDGEVVVEEEVPDVVGAIDPELIGAVAPEELDGLLDEVCARAGKPIMQATPRAGSIFASFVTVMFSLLITRRKYCAA